MQSTLILNASYEPLSIVPAKRAINLILAGRAVALDESNVSFSSEKATFAVPYVVRLNEFTHVKRDEIRAPRFSKRGILARDGFQCVYCGKAATTIDHVTPRMHGGQSTYDNCVAACLSCNRKKGHKTLQELGWTLKGIPKAPSRMVNMLLRAKGHTEEYKAWSEYIYMFEPKLRPVHH